MYFDFNFRGLITVLLLAGAMIGVIAWTLAKFLWTHVSVIWV